MKLWRENRTDQEWDATEDEIAEGFIAWSSDHPSSRPLEYQVRLYITEASGLNRIFEEPDFQRFLDRWWPWLVKEFSKA